MLFEKFISFIKSHNMFQMGDGVVAAVSGGADSVCLLYLLSKLRETWGIRIYVSHVNHNLRGTASRDEAFVAEVCKNLGVELRVLSVDVAGVSAAEKISVEMAGRKVRYEFFSKVMRESKSAAVLTAHNKNDQAETVLMNLIRGGGPAGLSGIRPKRPDGVCRPLLDITRSEIEEYLQFYGIKWRDDETNFETIYTRNLIRLRIMPLIEEINPLAVEAAARTAKILRAENDFLDEQTKKYGGVVSEGNRVVIKSEVLLLAPPVIQKRMVLYALELMGVSATMQSVEEILRLCKSGTGSKHSVTGGIMAICEYGDIVFLKEDKGTGFCYSLPEGGTLYIKEAHMHLTVEKPGSKKKDTLILPRRDGYMVRSRMAGDRFSPEGMDGTKKIKDFFIDAKVPQSLRDKIPIITWGGEIASVGNLRRDKKFVPRPNEDCILVNFITKEDE